MDKVELEKMKELHNKHWYFKAKKAIINHIMDTHSANGKVLDIGCGDGYFFDKHEGVGIEPCELFKKDNIINSDLETVELDEKFDFILALDVMEHLEDDTIIRKFIDKNLNENGIAIITVPAHRSLYGEHDKVHGHYRRYDKKDLELVLANYDCHISYINTVLYPIEYLVRKLVNSSNDVTLPLKPINWLLYKMFSCEKHFYKSSQFGLSLIAVIKK
jgi:Predicted methyltransferase (contains TPR repeat)